VRQIAHVTEHAPILSHGLLGGVVGAVGGMGTDKGEDSGEDGVGQVFGEVFGVRGQGRQLVAGAEVVVTTGPIPRTALAFGPLAKSAQ
jgi:hypothetical protein